MACMPIMPTHYLLPAPGPHPAHSDWAAARSPSARPRTRPPAATAPQLRPHPGRPPSAAACAPSWRPPEAPFRSAPAAHRPSAPHCLTARLVRSARWPAASGTLRTCPRRADTRRKCAPSLAWRPPSDRSAAATAAALARHTDTRRSRRPATVERRSVGDQLQSTWRRRFRMHANRQRNCCFTIFQRSPRTRRRTESHARVPVNTHAESCVGGLVWWAHTRGIRWQCVTWDANLHQLMPNEEAPVIFIHTL